MTKLQKPKMCKISNKSVEFLKSARTKVSRNFMSFPTIPKFPYEMMKKIFDFFQSIGWGFDSRQSN